MKNAIVMSPRWMPSSFPHFLSVFNHAACLTTTVFLLMLASSKSTTNGQYLVEILERAQLGGHRPVVRCEATGATFGGDVISFSFGMSAIGCALPTEPVDSCGNITKPELNSTSAHCFFDFAVVPRGNCTFSEKAYFAQNAEPSGYSALILFSAKGQSPIPMSGSKFADKVTIPVVMVNYGCMQSLLYGQYTARHGYVVTMKASPGYYDLIKYLVPFVAIVGLCFVVLFISLMIRLCRERRRQARKRLPRAHLKKIPTKKYRKGDPEETCAICLEDFQESEKLRVLPCRHAYHCKCIDPWLTKNRKVCPVCKRRVGPRNSDSSDSDETDAERTSSAGRSTATTTTTTGRGAAPTSSSAGSLVTSSRDNEPLLSNAQPIATTSSADCPPPYPQPHHHLITSRATIAGSGASTFMRAPTSLVHIANLFNRRANPSFAAAAAPTGHSAPLSAVVPQPSSIVGQQQQHEGADTGLDTNHHQQQQMSSALEANLAGAGVQQPTTSSWSSFPTSTTTTTMTTNGRESLSSASSPLQFVRSSFVGVRDRLANLISRAQRSDGSTPHLLLENEDDASSSATLIAKAFAEEADTLSRQTCDTLDYANGGSGGSSSIDGHSMTTMHSASNRPFDQSSHPVGLVASSSSVVDLSSCCTGDGVTPQQTPQQQQHQSLSTTNSNNNAQQQQQQQQVVQPTHLATDGYHHH